jgi:DNA-directed RNA polymerase specialized sigma24 family protein
MRIEYGNENDAVDAIVSGLPEQMRRSLVDVYGLDYPQRHAAERAGMNYRAFRDHLQAAIGGVATGLALLESRVEDAARASRLARLRVA